MQLVIVLLVVAVPEPKVIDRPIRFDAQRRELTLEYRRSHQDPNASSIEIEPRVIVLHHTGAEVEASFRTFDAVLIPPDRSVLAREGRVNVSAHFLVARDGTIYRLMPETWMARHIIGLNHVAIGIENAGGTPRAPLTQAQAEANAALIRMLVRRHPTITHLIGHMEYRRMERQAFWLERKAGYRTVKIDPGAEFLAEVRGLVLDLGLLGP